MAVLVGPDDISSNGHCVDANTKTVLIAVDDEALCVVLTRVLEVEGYAVRAAAASAVPWATRAVEPDVVILDLSACGDLPMWETEAVQRIWRLRTDPATAHIPLIALAEEAVGGAARPLLPLQECLPLPFDLVDLYEAIARWSGTIAGVWRLEDDGAEPHNPHCAPILIPLRWARHVTSGEEQRVAPGAPGRWRALLRRYPLRIDATWRE